MPQVTRRTVLKIAGIAAGVGAAGGGVAALVNETPRLLQQPPHHGPVATEPWLALNRAAFGPRPGELNAVRGAGARVWLERQLNPGAIGDDACERRLAAYKTLSMTAAQMNAAKVDDGDATDELDAATVLRAVYSERQLQEVLVGFWSDHFSIWHGKDMCPYLKTVDDRDVIRAHAFGRFRDLLGASAKSPAMLDYLDNWLSQAEHPNENYARELLELHTLGTGHYSERDVKEVARCLTGWTIKGDDQPDAGTFFFDSSIHDDGQKSVLGHVIPAGGGVRDGEIVLDLLTSHPATARRIATKLCRRFIADDPPDAAVSAVAEEFTRSKGSITDVLRAIFARDEFWQAEPKFKRPFEYVVGLLRAFAVDLDHDSTRDLLYALQALGHRPFDHITPEGYSDRGSRWAAELLARWNVALAISYGQHGKGDPLAVAQQQGAKSARESLDYYALNLLGRQPSKAESDALWGFVSKNGTPDLATDDGKAMLLDAIGLVAAAPAAQWR